MMAGSTVQSKEMAFTLSEEYCFVSYQYHPPHIIMTMIGIFEPTSNQVVQSSSEKLFYKRDYGIPMD